MHPIVAGFGDTEDATNRVTILRHWDANRSGGGVQHSTTVNVILVAKDTGLVEFMILPVL